jgi:hypothetical protein
MELPRTVLSAPRKEPAAFVADMRVAAALDELGEEKWR